jgi:hypothetical protein
MLRLRGSMVRAAVLLTEGCRFESDREYFFACQWQGGKLSQTHSHHRLAECHEASWRIKQGKQTKQTEQTAKRNWTPPTAGCCSAQPPSRSGRAPPCSSPSSRCAPLCWRCARAAVARGRATPCSRPPSTPRHLPSRPCSGCSSGCRSRAYSYSRETTMPTWPTRSSFPPCCWHRGARATSARHWGAQPLHMHFQSGRGCSLAR